MRSALTDDAIAASSIPGRSDTLERLARLLGIERETFAGHGIERVERGALDADHPPSLREALARMEEGTVGPRMRALLAKLDMLRACR